MLESEDKVRALRHDIKNHLLELQILAAKYHAPEMQNYLDDMKVFLQNPDEMVRSGNAETDSLLNYLLSKAKSTLKQVNAKVILPPEMACSFDVNTVLGNLLENAIEAAAGTEEQKLDVLVQYKQGVLHIAISNSYEGKIVQRNGEIHTTKPDAKHHGIGLRNVKAMIDKYNGDMEIVTRDNIFCVEVLLYL